LREGAALQILQDKAGATSSACLIKDSLYHLSTQVCLKIAFQKLKTSLLLFFVHSFIAGRASMNKKA
jgi:uncharacterized protein YfcZ (UPF0381/DUF406 family)